MDTRLSKFIVLGLLLLGGPARGESRQSLFNRMSAAYAAKDYDGVIRLFRRARLNPSKALRRRYVIPIWWYYAIALHDAGKRCDALAEYARMEALSAPKYMNQLDTLLPARKKRLTSLAGAVEFRCDGFDDAMVAVGGATARCGARVPEVAPGSHRPEVRLGPARWQLAPITVRACQTATVSLPRPGVVRWRDAPADASVHWRTRALGPAQVAHRLPAGRHTFEIRAPGRPPQRFEAVLRAGESTALTYVDASTSAGPSGAQWLAFGASVVLAGVGGYFVWSHLDDVDAQAEAQRAFDNETFVESASLALRETLTQKAEQAEASARPAFIFGVLGAASLLGSTIWLLSGDGSPTSSVGFDGRTLSIGGTW